jgi:hypothetical protein
LRFPTASSLHPANRGVTLLKVRHSLLWPEFANSGQASRAFVLSDVGTGAAERAGELREILVGWRTEDRETPGAMPPEELCLRDKSFSLKFISDPAKLFTVGCGEVDGLLAAG